MGEHRARFVAGCMAVAALVALAPACGKSGSDDAATFCKQYRTFETSDKALSRNDVNDPTSVSLTDAKAQVKKVDDQVADLASNAPDKIAADVKTLKGEVDALNDKVQAAKSARDLVTAETALKPSTTIQKAGDRVDAWVEDNCDSKGEKKS